ncbi:hypothetical protein ACFL0L_00875 [Patescibacteria group bacterium]
MKEVWIFGNPDLPEDALPIKMVPKLKELFPDIQFILRDPLDEWDMPKKLVIIDTVKGINKVTPFTSLEHFQGVPHVTMHDFDLGSHLAFMQKLGKLPEFVIYGVPDTISEEEALSQLGSLLR